MRSIGNSIVVVDCLACYVCDGIRSIVACYVFRESDRLVQNLHWWPHGAGLAPDHDSDVLRHNYAGDVI